MICSCVPRSSEVAPPQVLGRSTEGALAATTKNTPIWMWEKGTKFPAVSAASWQWRSLAKQLWGLPAWRRYLFSGDAMIFSQGNRVSSTFPTPSHWATVVFTPISVKCPSPVQLSECQELFQSSLGRIPTSPICVCTWWLSVMLKSNQESAWSPESSFANPPHCI